MQSWRARRWRAEHVVRAILGRIVVLLLLMIPSLLQPAQAGAAPARAEEVVDRVFLPALAGPPAREVMTTDTLRLGAPNQAATPAKPESTGTPSADGLQDPPAAGATPAPPDAPKAGSAFAPVTAAGWTAIMSEGFEGDFPANGWRVVDDTGWSDRELTWDDDDLRAASGAWSGWAANGGTNGLDPDTYRYADNMRAWMIYGPFSLQRATQATLTFSYWNRSEKEYDWFGWYASTDGVTFHGRRVSGDSNGWRTITFDLADVPTLGNLTGDTSVWIAFVFRSDGGKVDAGPFVDNIVLQEYATDLVCPDQARAEYFANPDFGGSPVLTRCEKWSVDTNWGDGSPAAGLPADEFAVRWTGTVAFVAGRYTFSAYADDGLRLWLNDHLLLDG